MVSAVAESNITDEQLEDILAGDSTVNTPSVEDESQEGTAFVSSPLVTRRRNAGKTVKFICTDSDISPRGAIIIPYTRAQYLALPRKKKKSVLTNVNKLIEYRRTQALLDALKALNSDNARIKERIANLEIKVAEKRRFIPDAKLWESCVRK